MKGLSHNNEGVHHEVLALAANSVTNFVMHKGQNVVKKCGYQQSCISLHKYDFVQVAEKTKSKHKHIR